MVGLLRRSGWVPYSLMLPAVGPEVGARARAWGTKACGPVRLAGHQWYKGWAWVSFLDVTPPPFVAPAAPTGP